MRKCKNNITNISANEAREYLDFITNTLTELIINRQIYLDVHNALIAQKATNNQFVSWIMRNYYQILVLNLCKLVEPKQTDDDRKTLKHFINLCKESINWNTIKSARLAAKQHITDIDTGEIIDWDFSYEINQIFENIDFEADLIKVENIHQRLKPYRDKEISHLTEINNVRDLSFKELHSFIDDIEDIMKKYYRMFGTAIIFDNLKTPNFYFNFSLNLR